MSELDLLFDAFEAYWLAREAARKVEGFWGVPEYDNAQYVLNDARQEARERLNDLIDERVKQVLARCGGYNSWDMGA